MTAAVVILASALVLAIGGVVAIAAWLRTAHVDRMEAKAELVIEQRRGDRIQKERDELAVRGAELATDVHELERRLAIAETQRNEAATREAEYVGNTIRNAGSGPAALDALNRELREPLLPEGRAPGTAGADRSGDGQAPTVHAAGDSDSTAPRRRS